MITVFLNDVELKRLEVPFIEAPIDRAVDVETLDGNVTTDWTARKKEWRLSWQALSEAEYNQLRAIYDAQFTNNAYPLLTIDYYNIEDLPVRMTINDKDIRWWGKTIENVSITLRETKQLGS